jgi:hypothetical protein
MLVDFYDILVEDVDSSLLACARAKCPKFQFKYIRKLVKYLLILFFSTDELKSSLGRFHSLVSTSSLSL